MSTTVGYIEEIPNMNYVLELSDTDFDFERKFISTMNKEFSWELGNYLYHIRQDEPRAAAEMVHKIKYKFAMLGMKQAFCFSEYYEEELHKGDMTLDDDFKKILKTVNEYLKTF